MVNLVNIRYAKHIPCAGLYIGSHLEDIYCLWYSLCCFYPTMLMGRLQHPQPVHAGERFGCGATSRRRTTKIESAIWTFMIQHGRKFCTFCLENNAITSWWFRIFIFSSLNWEWLDPLNIFQVGRKHQPDQNVLKLRRFLGEHVKTVLTNLFLLSLLSA